MSTSTWSTEPLSACRAASASGNAGRPAFMYRLPDRDTTPSRTPSRETTHQPCPGWLLRKLAGRRIRSSLIEVGVDLAVPVGVVAERDHIDPGGEQLVGDLRRDPEPAGRVLAVDDYERRGQPLAQRRAAATATFAGRFRRRRRQQTGCSTGLFMSAGRSYFHLNGFQGSEANKDGARRSSAAARARGRARRSRGRRADPAAGRGDARPMTSGSPAQPSLRWSSRAGSSSSCCRSRCSGCGRSRGRPDPVLLILLAASTVALILNPLVKMLERRRIPRGLAILAVYLAGFAILAGVGVLLANLISTQVSQFANDVPSLVRHANHDLANLQNWLNKQRDPCPDPAAGSDGAADAREERAQELGQHRLVLAGPARQADHDRLRPGPGPRALDLPARVRQADRRARRGRIMPPRRRDARRTTSRCSSSARCSATSAARSCSA